MFELKSSPETLSDIKVCWVRLLAQSKESGEIIDMHALFLADTPLKLIFDRTDDGYSLRIMLPNEPPPALGPGLVLNEEA